MSSHAVSANPRGAAGDGPVSALPRDDAGGAAVLPEVLEGNLVRLTLPMPPNVGGNSRMHWRMKHRTKLAYWDACDMRVVLRVNPKAPAAPLDPAHIAAKFYVHQTHDVDNLMSRAKLALDWLVSRGYIHDDAPRHLKWAGIPEQEVDRKNQRLEVEVRAA